MIRLPSEKTIGSLDNNAFWHCKDNWRIWMKSDGHQFIATICAGVDGDNFLSVGYSCPNYALMKGEENFIPEINDALDEQWNKTEEIDLNDMLPALYELCKVANKKYNELLWRKYEQ